MPDRDGLADRTRKFAIQIVRLCRRIPRNPINDPIIRQLVRAGTGPAANYRAARRARSRAEFTARLGVVVEEADESVFWLGLIRDAEILRDPELPKLLTEAGELLAIFATSRSRALRNQRIAR